MLDPYAQTDSYTTILLCRPSRSIGNVHRTEAWGDSIQAQSAANETTRIVEDLLMSGMCRLCQIHAYVYFTTLFGVLGVEQI